MLVRTVLRLLTATALVLTALSAGFADPDPGIVAAVAHLFAQRPDTSVVSVVYVDAVNWNYMAFHLSTYLHVRELRVYLIPFASADRAQVDEALARGDHETAFQSLLEGMRLELGARYVSDAGLDGISEVAIPLGQGSLRDNFHREQFASYADADRAYRQWIQRALELARR